MTTGTFALVYVVGHGGRRTAAARRLAARRADRVVRRFGRPRRPHRPAGADPARDRPGRSLLDAGSAAEPQPYQGRDVGEAAMRRGLSRAGRRRLGRSRPRTSPALRPDAVMVAIVVASRRRTASARHAGPRSGHGRSRLPRGGDRNPPSVWRGGAGSSREASRADDFPGRARHGRCWTAASLDEPCSADSAPRTIGGCTTVAGPRR